MIRKLTGSLFLSGTLPVSSLTDLTPLPEDAFSCAQHIADCGADELIVWDTAPYPEESKRNEALSVIRAICAESDIPVICSAAFRRMEDVKKLLYAGCKRVILTLSDACDADEALFREVSAKFGRERIIAAYRTKEQLTASSEWLSSCAGTLLLTGVTTVQDVRALLQQEEDSIVNLPDCSFEDAVEILSAKNISAVCGPYVDKHLADLAARKQTLDEIGIATSVLKPAYPWSQLKKNEQGLVPVIVQDYRTQEVLMLAYMNESAYAQTFESGRMTYYSRERKTLWTKGEESGHFQYVREITADCDLDTLLAKVKQIGAACHTGSRSCFFNDIVRRAYPEKNPRNVLEDLSAVIQDRREHPREGSYTNYLFDKGLDKVLKKLGEEATEITIAAKNEDASELHYEMADYLYHLMVLMNIKGVTWEEITDELARR